MANEQRQIPSKIVVQQDHDILFNLSEAVSQLAQRKVEVIGPARGRVENWLQLAMDTARENVKGKIADKIRTHQRFIALESLLKLNEKVQRIECFDISHISGPQWLLA